MTEEQREAVNTACTFIAKQVLKDPTQLVIVMIAEDLNNPVDSLVKCIKRGL